jgi:hypothetical protein
VSAGHLPLYAALHRLLAKKATADAAITVLFIGENKETKRIKTKTIMMKQKNEGNETKKKDTTRTIRNVCLEQHLCLTFLLFVRK